MKPANHEGYDPKVTEDCERVLVTLLRGLGPWKESVYLIGGLTPRYLVAKRPPNVPPHAGTTDVDVVVELQILAKTDAYATLEQNLKRMGFERAYNDKGKRQSWRWQTTNKASSGIRMILEILADDPEKSGGKIVELPSEGNVSALNIPHSSMVFDHYLTREITAALLDGKGNATEVIRHADIVSFTCLKALAFDDRAERKDAHDLVYCLEYGEGGVSAAAQAISAARSGRHADAVKKTIAILEKHFSDDANSEGYLKSGSVAVALFEYGERADNRENRLLRQRDVSALIQELLKSLKAAPVRPRADLKPSGTRGRSPLAPYEDWVKTRIEQQPNVTLKELRDELSMQGVKTSASALSRLRLRMGLQKEPLASEQVAQQWPSQMQLPLDVRGK